RRAVDVRVRAHRDRRRTHHALHLEDDFLLASGVLAILLPDFRASEQVDDVLHPDDAFDAPMLVDDGGGTLPEGSHDLARGLRRSSSRCVATPPIFFRARTGTSWTSLVFTFPSASPIVASGATVTRSVVMKPDTRRCWTLFRFMVNPLGWEAAIAEVRIRKFFRVVSIHEIMESRATVIFRGRVQGVYFRANCAEKAESLGLHGYVRNLPEGSVEAVLEGER